jgi:hypothetical protein
MGAILQRRPGVPDAFFQHNMIETGSGRRPGFNHGKLFFRSRTHADMLHKKGRR